MIRLLSVLAVLFGLFAVVPAQVSPALAAQADSNTIYLDTAYGRAVIKLRPDLAPRHVEQIKTLVKRGFYNGIVFHRVIDGFMAQTGDPTGTGTGGSDLPDLKAEFTNKAKFVRGVVGMARSSDPDSANSQFFIMYAPQSSLDGQYTIVGEVTSGMEAIDKLKKGDEADNGMVTNPDKIIKMQLAPGAK
ncbi:peptidylprolyl isomerase [Labrys okinawensis]|uniref:peptidylprolyl isomerase n=1 Tax=Labrys okinawensis TaxID=346911 RepID=UPI0039BC7B3D